MVNSWRSIWNTKEYVLRFFLHFLRVCHKSRIFAVTTENIYSMTTFELNAEIYNNLNYIANDESKLRKALEAIKRIIYSKDDEKITFPKIDHNFQISEKVRNGVIGALPKDVDFDKETERMWENLAK